MNSDYNPRYGRGQGRVGKDDLSFDGKSWEYRRPGETLDRPLGRKQAFIDEAGYNPHAQKMLNPLYDYSYGDVRDASKILGIGNVNEQEEVDRLLTYLREGPVTTDKETETEVKEPKVKAPPNLTREEAAKPPEIEAAQSRLDDYRDAIIKGRTPNSVYKSGSESTIGAEDGFAQQDRIDSLEEQISQRSIFK